MTNFVNCFLIALLLFTFINAAHNNPNPDPSNTSFNYTPYVFNNMESLNPEDLANNLAHLNIPSAYQTTDIFQHINYIHYLNFITAFITNYINTNANYTQVLNYITARLHDHISTNVNGTHDFYTQVLNYITAHLHDHINTNTPSQFNTQTNHSNDMYTALTEDNAFNVANTTHNQYSELSSNLRGPQSPPSSHIIENQAITDEISEEASYAAANNSNMSFKTRHFFTDEERNYLETIAVKTLYPDKTTVSKLSLQLGVPERSIKLWFQSRRTTLKKRGYRLSKAMQARSSHHPENNNASEFKDSEDANSMMLVDFDSNNYADSKSTPRTSARNGLIPNDIAHNSSSIANEDIIPETSQVIVTPIFLSINAPNESKTIKVVLTGRNIPLYLDPNIYKYQNLRSLTINNTNIVKMPDRFNELQLEYLDLSHNKIDVLSYKICKIKTLKELNVSHNSIRSLNGIINNLKGLVHFDISHNKLKKIAEVRFLDFINLKSADFSNNCLEAIQSTIFKLGSLEKG